MPRISFNFSGSVNNAPVESALEVSTSKFIDVSQMSSEDLVAKLEAGELAISFLEVYSNSSNDDLEMNDYEAED